jgi:hypothetical protein
MIISVNLINKLLFWLLTRHVKLLLKISYLNSF